ncbi:MAG: ATP-binding cassette domain-containing protein [Paracoccaceae bacterium]
MSLLSIDSVARSYRLPRRRLLSPAPKLRAVDGISLSLARGEVLGIVGESGSGKSTLARLIMGFERPDAGAVQFDGHDLATLPRAALRALRPRLQMVFQDPFDSLDPRRPVGWSVAEPLLQDRRLDGEARRARAADMLERVRLSQADMEKYPHEFSGGQRQRIAIARALVTDPALLVADEPVAALDVSVQAHVLNLLSELQARLGVAMIFISHDLAVVASIADRIAVMQRGRIVEEGPVRQILTAPRAAYTRTLFAHA